MRGILVYATGEILVREHTLVLLFIWALALAKDLPNFIFSLLFTPDVVCSKNEDCR